ncbi:type II secretion system protein [Thermocrinis sp.]|uniref:PilW family protein n=1 Tax=Thermocrinis sp. TaxID=2024383 RepID=UPI002FDEA767
MNRKGFTLIEFLVAMLILFILMTGFLRGILLYKELQIRNQLKDRASEILNHLSNYIRSAQFNPSALCDSNNPSPFLCAVGYSYPNNWDSSNCLLNASCTFENADTDGDQIADFYDPYSGANRDYISNPMNVAAWLRVVPCNCGPNSCGCCYRDTGTPIPGMNCGERYKGRFIYTATNLASIRRSDTNAEIGRAVGIVVWYFDPQRNYKYISSTVIRSMP